MITSYVREHNLAYFGNPTGSVDVLIIVKFKL